MTDERDAQRAQIKAAWSDAGERLSGLGAKLKAHYAEQQGTEPERAGADVKEAVKRLGEAVQDAVDALGAAAKDPAVKSDVREVGQSMAGALSSTFSGLGEELRRAFDGTKGQARGAEPTHPADGEPGGAAPAAGGSGGGGSAEYGTPPQDAPAEPSAPVGDADAGASDGGSSAPADGGGPRPTT